MKTAITLTEHEIAQAVAEYIARKKGRDSGWVQTSFKWNGTVSSTSEFVGHSDPHSQCAIPCGKDCTR